MGIFSRAWNTVSAKARTVGIDVRRKVAILEGLVNKEQKVLKDEAITTLRSLNFSKEKSQMINALYDLAKNEGVEFSRLEQAIQREEAQLQPLIGYTAFLRKASNAGLSPGGLNPQQLLQELSAGRNVSNEARAITVTAVAELQQAEVLRRQLNEQNQILVTLSKLLQQQLRQLGGIERETQATEFTDKEIGQLTSQLGQELQQVEMAQASQRSMPTTP